MRLELWTSFWLFLLCFVTLWTLLSHHLPFYFSSAEARNHEWRMKGIHHYSLLIVIYSRTHMYWTRSCFFIKTGVLWLCVHIVHICFYSLHLCIIINWDSAGMLIKLLLLHIPYVGVVCIVEFTWFSGLAVKVSKKSIRYIADVIWQWCRISGVLVINYSTENGREADGERCSNPFFLKDKRLWLKLETPSKSDGKRGGRWRETGESGMQIVMRQDIKDSKPHKTMLLDLTLTFGLMSWSAVCLPKT